jgi:hypothetical protein
MTIRFPLDTSPKHVRETLEYWITTIQEEGKRVTKWESDFVASLADQLEENGRLSERQIDILEKIYANRT